MFGTFLPCVFNFWNLFGHLNFDYMNFIIIFFFLRATVPNLRKFKKKGVFGCNVIHIHQKNQHLNKFLNREFLTLLRCWKQIGGCITMTFIIFCVFIIIIFSILSYCWPLIPLAKKKKVKNIEVSNDISMKHFYHLLSLKLNCNPKILIAFVNLL